MKLFDWKRKSERLEKQNRELRQRNERLEQRVRQLEAENAELTQKLAAAKKHSGNSSKPPSSDIVNADNDDKGKQKPKNKGRRPIGGQKGHRKHERSPFSPEQIDDHVPHRLDRCPLNPSHRIVQLQEAKRSIQQIELVEKPFRILEHTAYSIWCEDCGCQHHAPLPEEVFNAGLFGPRLSALTVYLKSRLHGSYSGVRDFLEDVVGVRVSRGYVAKLLYKASCAFEQPYQELIDLLPLQSKLNIDETGHKENGQRFWTWCFRAKTFTVFKIDPSRSSEVLMRTLGEQFKGILGCDYYSAYRKYARQCSVLVQFCLAHLIRDVKYLCEFPDPQVQRYGRKLLEQIRNLFSVLHRRDELDEVSFRGELDWAYEQIWSVAFPDFKGPYHRLILNMAKRFEKHGAAYLQFITTPDVDPTNNNAEQAIRFVVMDRHITQGTRSRRGRRICERLWTVMATCSMQKRSPFRWICDAIGSYISKKPIPSLLLDST